MSLSLSWKRRVLEPVLALFRQGMSDETIALSIALGVVLGVFPVFGCPTIFCALAALALGLNLPAIQAVNYLAYPLQIILLAPFICLGRWMFRFTPGSTSLLTAGLHAIVAWFCVCVPAGLLLYMLTCAVLRRRHAPAFSDLRDFRQAKLPAPPSSIAATKTMKLVIPSEIKPYGKLRFPHILHQAVDRGNGVDVGNVGVRQSVVRMVKSVEHFEPESQPPTLAEYRKAFRQAAIDHINTGTDQNITSRISKAGLVASRTANHRRWRESGCVEPA